MRSFSVHTPPDPRLTTLDKKDSGTTCHMIDCEDSDLYGRSSDSPLSTSKTGHPGVHHRRTWRKGHQRNSTAATARDFSLPRLNGMIGFFAPKAGVTFPPEDLVAQTEVLWLFDEFAVL
ncbi:hypothetical protein CF319_g7192 [Tilletia indica]|nr:hypothetical protein CF319_g7192 [Tilletia indica]